MESRNSPTSSVKKWPRSRYPSLSYAPPPSACHASSNAWATRRQSVDSTVSRDDTSDDEFPAGKRYVSSFVAIHRLILARGTFTPRWGTMSVMTETFHDDHRYWQDHFDSRRIADRIDELLVADRIDPHAKRFIESRDMFFLATCDSEGNPQCSYKGGEPGFVRVLDDQTLSFPVYDGNGMFLSLGNVRQHANVGMLFVDFEHPNRLRVNGVATADERDPLVGEFVGAKLVVRVRTTQVFPNCSRYIHTMELKSRSPFVPQPAATAPVPDWKRMTWAHDYLPEGDPARDTEPIG